MRKTIRRLEAAGRAATKLLFKPCFKPAPKKLYVAATVNKFRKAKSCWTKEYWVELFEYMPTFASIEAHIFPNLPEHYSLGKKMAMSKQQSIFGKLWDVWMVLMSLWACAQYIAETYDASFNSVQLYSLFEIVITQFFAIDFIWNMITAPILSAYMTNSWTIVDMLTIVPVYITLALEGQRAVNLSIFRFIRILRLVRILRMFKLLNGLSGVKRQLITLSLTMLSLLFIAAGIINILENDLKQLMEYKCNFIGENTLWSPSCDISSSFDPSAPGTCDCVSKGCFAFYSSGDKYGQPSGVRCPRLSYFDCFYYMVVTVATVGYGDISPSTEPTRAVVLVFIVTSLVVIPMQVNQLVSLLSMTSAYRNPYVSINNESHVILCGYMGDWRKLEKFLKEFFHPDRAFSLAPEFHILLLSPSDPSEDIRALLSSNQFDGRISYLIGSALNMEDLQRARADTAAAMFFLCNPEVNETLAKLDDAATIMRTLSVTNCNPALECMVQVLKPEDRDILKESDVDVILCLDEYKSCVQAHNAVCPGLSTFVENLFHTFGNMHELPHHQRGRTAQWLEDYTYGANKEPYFVLLNIKYAEALSFEWALIVEGIYLEFDCMVIGVASTSDHSLIVNPTKVEMNKFRYNSRFFDKYNILIIVADEQSQANVIASATGEQQVIDRIVQKLLIAEDYFSVRKLVRIDEDLKEGIELPPTTMKELVRSSKMYNRNSSASTTANKAADDSDDEGKGEESDGDAEYTGFVSKNDNLLRKSGKKGGGQSASSSKTGSNPMAQLQALLAQTLLLGGNQKTAKVSSKEDSDDDSYPDTDDDDEEEDEAVTKAKQAQQRRMSAFNQPAAIARNGVPPPIAMPSTPQRPSNGKSLPGGARRMSIKESDILADLNLPNQAFLAGAAAGHAQAVKGANNAKLSSPKRNNIDTAGSQDKGASLAALVTGPMEDDEQALGRLVEDASEIKRHIIVFGSMLNLSVFVAELRKSLLVKHSYHPIVVVAEEIPDRWDYIVELYSDIYYIRGKMSNSRDFNRTNIHQAYACVLLAGRDSVTKVEEENLDADTLFSYLKLEKYIPRDVFFTVELACQSNMAVLNTTVMRRAKESILMNKANAKTEGASKGNQTSSSSKGGGAGGGAGGKGGRAVVVSNKGGNGYAVVVEAKEQFKGTFSTHMKAVKQDETNLSRAVLNSLKYAPARRMSSIQHLDDAKPGASMRTTTRTQLSNAAKDQLFWTSNDTHHRLPVFASGNAFVPANFDSLLVQSFFSSLTPLLCERLVCGSKTQMCFQVPVPEPFVDRYFVDLYRTLLSRGITCMAIYRAAAPEDKSVLPFVYTCPRAETILRERDRLFLYCSPDGLRLLTSRAYNSNMRGSISLSDDSLVKPLVQRNVGNVTTFALSSTLAQLVMRKAKENKRASDQDVEETETAAGGATQTSVAGTEALSSTETAASSFSLRSSISKIFEMTSQAKETGVTLLGGATRGAGSASGQETKDGIALTDHQLIAGVEDRTIHAPGSPREVSQTCFCSILGRALANSLAPTIKMGIVFGITGTKEPSYSMWHTVSGSPYEIRSYQPYLVAEVLSNDENKDQAFGILAKYIGVFGNPANKKNEAMAMTAPVLMEAAEGQRLAMTSPLLSSEKKESMAFVLPFEYASLDQLPTPTDRRVSLRAVPSKIVAVSTFSGWYSNSAGRGHFEELQAHLRDQNLLDRPRAAGDASDEEAEWSVSQYHPPFTLPFLRRNEVWVPLDGQRAEVRAITSREPEKKT